MRRWLAVVAGAAFLLAPDGWIAGAEARPSKARVDLVRGAAAGAPDAQGRMEVVRDSRGDRLKLRLRNLEPRTQYEVRDAATKESLAGFRTNRSGRGKARLFESGLTGLGIEICENGSDEPVLEGQVPGDEEFYPPWEEMSFRTGTVSTDWDAAVQVSVTLTSVGDPDSAEGNYESLDLWVSGTGVAGPVALWITDDEGVLQPVMSVDAFSWDDPMPLPPDGEPMMGGLNTTGPGRHARHARHGKSHPSADGSTGDCPDWGDWVEPDSFFSGHADNTTEEGLPFGLTAAADLTGRAFEVRDGDGNVLFYGELPALEEIVFEPMPVPDPSEWGDWTGGGISFEFNIDVSVFIQIGEGDGSVDWDSLFDDWMALLKNGL